MADIGTVFLDTLMAIRGKGILAGSAQTVKEADTGGIGTKNRQENVFLITSSMS